MNKLIIMDLDDTLINTQPLYLDKIHKLGLKMAELGFDYYETVELEKIIDIKCIRENGVARRRFPNSLGTTYKELCKKYNKPVSEELVAELVCMGYSTYTELSAPFPKTKETLEGLQKMGYTLVILTKGEKDIQTRRVLDSGLIGFFDQTFITMDKSPKLFKSICSFYGVSPEKTVMVGNSIHSDILPALEAGLYGFHIEHGTFNYEGPLQFNPGDHQKYVEIKSITDLPGSMVITG